MLIKYLLSFEHYYGVAVAISGLLLAKYSLIPKLDDFGVIVCKYSCDPNVSEINLVFNIPIIILYLWLVNMLYFKGSCLF